MLKPRIIPCLLLQNKGLVKTVNFNNPRYIGDPINAIKIFNEKAADELMLIDIDATVRATEPDYKLIEHVAAECQMPFCYGGGIKTVEQARRIIGLGVEKIAISSAVIEMPSLVQQIAEQLGSQSVVVILDIKKQKTNGAYTIWINNGKLNTSICPFIFSQMLEKLGVGEIVINSIDRDGAMQGYDLELVNQLCKLVTVPVTVLGGAGSLKDIGQLIQQYSIIGAAAGSLFVFKGSYKAVLINYPSQMQKNALLVNNS